MFKQHIDIPMGVDYTLFWVNLFLYFFESKYVKSLIFLGSSKAYKYHGTGRFIYDLCTLNYGNEFFKSFKKIYPKELELKIEHQGTHIIFLDLE